MTLLVGKKSTHYYRDQVLEEMSFWRLGFVLTITTVMWCWGDIPCPDKAYEDTDYGTGDTNCHLTSQSFYSYVVRIWNTDWGNTSAHGSILSYTAILTNCAQFVRLQPDKSTKVLPFEKLLVHGQKLRNETDPDWSVDGPNICYQTRKVINVIPHDKCQLKQQWDIFFNFAILVIDKPFLVFRQHSYPVIQLPNTIHVAVFYVVLVNVVRMSGCEIPLLYFHQHQKPTFAKNLGVISLRWVTECMAKLCEMDPFVFTPSVFRYPGQFPTSFDGDHKAAKKARDNAVKQCLNSMQKAMNFTMLCVYFPHSSLIKLGHNYMDVRSHLWTGGAPLVCNGTAIGLTAAAKDRSRMSSFRQDFYLINTFIRVWPWLMDQRPKYGQDWLEDHKIEKEMKERGALARDAGPKPPVDPNLVRSWPEDPNPYSASDRGLKNRSTRNQQFISSVSSILAAISTIVISRIDIRAFISTCYDPS